MKHTLFKIKKTANSRRDDLESRDKEGSDGDYSPFRLCEEKMLHLMDMFESVLKQTLPTSQNVSISHHKSATMIAFDLQQRDKHPFLPIPPKQNDSVISNRQLENWITEVCSKVFSTAFNYYSSQKMTYQQVRIFCSQGIVKNLLRMTEIHSLSPVQIQLLDRHMDEKIIPYLQKKYPLTEQSVVNKALANAVEEVNNIDALSNDFFSMNPDLIPTFRKDGNYNGTIMKVINRVLEQIDAYSLVEEDGKPKEGVTNYKDFEGLMGSLFEKVEDLQWMKKGHSFKNTSIRPSTSQQTDDQHQKYKQNVRSYTHSLIGRKVSQNIELFTPKQIDNHTLIIKHPAMLRILTKWCQQLWNKFKTRNYMINREQGVQVQQMGHVNVLFDNHKLYIDSSLKNQRQCIEQFMEELQRNFYGQQAVQMKHYLKDEENTHIERLERAFGKHSYQTVSCLHNYIILYLNRLIHGLITVGNSFHERFTFKDLEEWRYPPNLITFKIGDLVRSKCSSKQTEIMRIYGQIVRISSQRPDKMKIVRIKNRLKQGTNDILINIKFNNLILGEIQLAVNTKKSKFIESSNSFSHYLYELQRSIFGPISELCSIWKSLDKRSIEFERIIQAQSHQVHKKEINQLETTIDCQHEYCHFNLSFQCSFCRVIYNHNNYVISNEKCLQCQTYKCSRCKFQQLNLEEVKRFLGIKEEIVIKTVGIIDQTLPGKFFVSFSMHGRQPKVEYFRKIIVGGIEYFMKKQGGKITEVVKNNKAALATFIEQNIVYSTNKEVGNSLSEAEAKQLFLLPNYIKKCYQNEKELISLNRKEIKEDEDYFEKVLKCEGQFERGKTKVKRLEMAANNLKNVQFIFPMFPNLQELKLYSNEIRDLTNISNIKSLKILSLQNNKIDKLPEEMRQLRWLEDINIQSNSLARIDEVLDCVSLKVLNIRSNLIKVIPDRIDNLKNLEQLLIEKNRGISKLPATIGHLSKLKKLKASQCAFTFIPEEIGKLSDLRTLEFSRNAIEEIPECIGNLSKLQIFRIQQGKLTNLPASLSKLQNIAILDFSGNKIQQSLINFSRMNKLRILDLCKNALLQLDNSICEATDLQELILDTNVLEKLPYNLGNCSKLNNLSLSMNKITLLPYSLSNCPYILRRSNGAFTCNNNKLQQFPIFICEPKIESLSLVFNEIKTIPPQIKLSINLTTLILNNNKIHVLPEEISQLTKLKRLQINNNLLEELPDSIFKEMVGLDVLNAGGNRIVFVSQFVYQFVKTITLSHNRLIELNFPTKRVDQQKFFFLTHNQIKEIPITITNYSNLRKLHLGNNQISVLPKYLEGVSNIEHVKIHLENNPVSRVDCESLMQGKFDLDIKMSLIQKGVVKPTVGKSHELKKN